MLSAHGDLGKGIHSSVLKEWDVRKIMKSLEKLGNNFYPLLIRIVVGSNEVYVEEAENGIILDKKSLLALYGRDGDFLHRGSLKKLFLAEPKDVSQEIIDWSARIVALLQEHRIILFGQDKQLMCRMVVPPMGRPQSFTIAAPSRSL